jgi:hypothetical protein
MNIRLIILFCTIALNVGCTLIGYKLGEKVDKATDRDKFANQYAEEGLDVDVEIVKALLSRSEKNQETWNDPWVEEQQQKYCSQVPSCWNKRSINQSDSTDPDSTEHSAE